MASAAESSAAGGMRKAPSLEWRWVSTEEDDDEDRAGAGVGTGTPAAVGAVGRGGSFESEDDEDDDEEEEEKEKGRKRLIRTVPSVDWFDVEGNEVSVAQQLDDSEEFDFGRTMFLALQTLFFSEKRRRSAHHYIKKTVGVRTQHSYNTRPNSTHSH